jgi:glycosyltransferase involved in cell wall biosynthesis
MIVDVIIPCAGSGFYFKVTLARVLSQTYKSIKVLVCDNACAHSVYKDVVDEFGDSRVIYKKFEKRLPLILNWQRCLEQRTAEYFCILHDDDYWPQDFLSSCMLIMNPNVSYVLACNVPFSAAVSTINSNDHKIWRQLPKLNWPEFRVFQALCSIAHLSAAVFRASRVNFNPLLTFNGDQAFFFDNGFIGEGIINLDVVVGIRQHTQSSTSAFPSAQASREVVFLQRDCILRLLWSDALTIEAIRKISFITPPDNTFRLIRTLFSWPLFPELYSLGKKALGCGEIIRRCAEYSKIASIFSRLSPAAWVLLGVLMDCNYYLKIRKLPSTFIYK